jgi:FHA domain
MWLIRQLRELASRLDDEALQAQLGPFVLVQRPYRVQGMSVPQTTQPLDRPRGPAYDEFDELRVATLPPLRPGDSLVVGRAPDCDLVLDEATVSGRHARLEWDGAAAWLSDLGSCNGIRVNGARLPGRQRLVDRDTLDFGRVKLEYLLVQTLCARLRQGARRVTLPPALPRS